MSCHFGRTVTLGRSLLSGFDRKVKKLTLLSGSHYFRGGGGGGAKFYDILQKRD